MTRTEQQTEFLDNKSKESSRDNSKFQPVNPWSITPLNKIAFTSGRRRQKINNQLYLEYRIIKL